MAYEETSRFKRRRKGRRRALHGVRPPAVGRGSAARVVRAQMAAAASRNLFRQLPVQFSRWQRGWVGFAAGGTCSRAAPRIVSSPDPTDAAGTKARPAPEGPDFAPVGLGRGWGRKPVGPDRDRVAHTAPQSRQTAVVTRLEGRVLRCDPHASAIAPPKVHTRGAANGSPGTAQAQWHRCSAAVAPNRGSIAAVHALCAGRPDTFFISNPGRAIVQRAGSEQSASADGRPGRFIHRRQTRDDRGTPGLARIFAANLYFNTAGQICLMQAGQQGGPSLVPGFLTRGTLLPCAGPMRNRYGPGSATTSKQFAGKRSTGPGFDV